MLQTDPSGGIPAGLRKRPTAEDLAAMLGDADDLLPAAAGIRFSDPNGNVLLLKRSAKGDHPGEWCFPGGMVEGDETPEQAARREAIEETGHKESGPLKLLDRTAADGIDFHTFSQPVGEQFEPRLNDEHDEHVWVHPEHPPEPLHPGVRTLMTKTAIAMDEIKNQDQVFKVREDLVAADSALLLALDRDTVREMDRDGRMRVKVANISKACINPYKGHEIPDWEKLGLDPNHVYHLLRDPEELAKAAATFNGVQILRKHTPVSAEDAQQWEVVGATGTDAAFNDPYLTNSLSIWTKEAIDEIESEAKRELSCGYHYKADMTPGNFSGKAFDGVMRDIVGNHVALVEDGRAGPDVVVGDSAEEIMSEATKALAKTLNAAAHRQTSVYALNTYLRTKIAKPLLAMDAKPLGIMAKVFDGITGKNFKDKKGEIATRLKTLTQGKLAKDASLDDVEKVLDMLDGHEVDGGDESVSEPQHNAMEAAAHGQSTLGIPQKVGEEFTSKDASEGLKGFLKEKGMGEDDIAAATNLAFPPKPAVDEDDEAKKKREKEEADKAAAAKAKDAEMDTDKDKDKVTKPAMDAAITAATEATAKRVKEEVRATERGIREAETAVRPFVGELPALAFDSAEEVYRHALTMLGVQGAKDIHVSALPTILKMQPKAGAKPSQHSERIGMDAAAVDNINKRFPGIERITSV